MTRRTTANDPWGEAVNLGPIVNSVYNEEHLFISADGLLLFFDDYFGETHRPGGYGSQDIWFTRRADLSAPWEEPVNLGPKVNGSAYDFQPRISPDGHMLYFGTALTVEDSSTWDYWQVSITPIVDFNGDEMVNLDDLVILIDNWGTNETLCDIGPFAWGDGVVDIEDLKVFMSYWEQENIPENSEDEK